VVVSRSEFTAEEHRERARQCLYLARGMADSPSKAMLLHMAQVWIKLAETLERSDGESETDTPQFVRQDVVHEPPHHD
jgi:hypothetical protein